MSVSQSVSGFTSFAPAADPIEDAIEECKICMSDLDAKIKQLACQHTFHADCIDRWLIAKPLCPTCRFNVALLTPEQFPDQARREELLPMQPEEAAQLDVDVYRHYGRSIGRVAGDIVALGANAIFHGCRIGEGPMQVLLFSTLTLGGLLLANGLSLKIARKLQIETRFVTTPARAIAVALTVPPIGASLSNAMINGTISLAIQFAGKKIGEALGGWAGALYACS